MVASVEFDPEGKRPIGWWRWLLRGLGCLVAFLLFAFTALALFYFLVVAPQERARKAEADRKAAAFARLAGPARRLAIYDAFVAAIDEHYFDRTFAGFDWPKLKREWRPKAAAAADDFGLYFDVFLPMSQAFPVSHISALPPKLRRNPGNTSAPPPAFSEEDVGAQFFAFLRRGKGVHVVIGEVEPNAAAANAGVQPGALIEKASITADRKGAGHVSAKLLCLTPSESHRLEYGLETLTIPLDANACQARPGRRLTVSYNFHYGRPRPDVIVRRLSSGARYVRFDTFQDAILDKVIAALKTADARGIVIDLRYNHGGYVSRLVDALFPARDPLYRRRDARGLHVISTPFWGFHYGGPIVLLTGPSSASAAEVTAAIIQSKHRGLLVGRATSGSVLGSPSYDLPDGGKVQIPAESIETLDGKKLEGVGVRPDIEIYPTVAELRAGKDPALERAEAELRKAAAIRH